jgi:hypothetical protein
LREESEQQRGHVLRKIFCEFLRPKYFSAVGGRTVRIRTVCTYGFGMEIEAIFGTVFEAVFRFSVGFFGPYGTVRTSDCGHGKRGTEEAGQQYDFGTKNEADFCGTDLVL